MDVRLSTLALAFLFDAAINWPRVRLHPEAALAGWRQLSEEEVCRFDSILQFYFRLPVNFITSDLFADPLFENL